MFNKKDDLIPDFMQEKPKKSPDKKSRIIRFLRRHIKPVIIIAILIVIALVGSIIGISASRTNDEENHENSKSEISSVISADPESSEDKQDNSVALTDPKDQAINSLNEEIRKKDSQISEYEAKISSLEVQLAAKTALENSNGQSSKTCYLTFDDGPSDNTLKILDVLAKYNIKATFFVTNNSKLSYVKNINDAGHTVGLHTATHKWSIYSSSDSYYDDLNTIRDSVAGIIGIKSNIIRFPGGSSNTASKKYCEGIMSFLSKDVIEKGYYYFDWNVDSGDADGNRVPADKIISNIKNGPTQKENIVVLMHDADVKTTTVEALPQIIEFYASNGYTFSNITENTPAVHHGVKN